MMNLYGNLNLNMGEEVALLKFEGQSIKLHFKSLTGLKQFIAMTKLFSQQVIPISSTSFKLTFYIGSFLVVESTLFPKKWMNSYMNTPDGWFKSWMNARKFLD